MQEQTFINFVGHFAPVVVLYMFCNAKLASEFIFYGWVDPLMAVIFFLLVIQGKETCAYLVMKNCLISHLFLKMRKAPFSKLDLWLMSPKNRWGLNFLVRGQQFSQIFLTD